MTAPTQAQVSASQSAWYRDNLGSWKSIFPRGGYQRPRVVRDLRAGVPDRKQVVRQVLATCERNEDADMIVAALNESALRHAEAAPQVTVAGKAEKALTIVQALANTPWQEWQSLNSIWRGLAEFRNAALSAPARQDEKETP